MRLRLFHVKTVQFKEAFSKNLKVAFLLIVGLSLVGILSACTPYRGQVYSQTSLIRPPAPPPPAPPPPNANGAHRPPPPYQNGQPPAPPPPNHKPAHKPGVQALFYCTEELGHNPAFNANDYQHCLQLNQATLTDYALNMLKDYILTWADYAIDAALQALGFSSGRSYMTPASKSAQLTSMISTGYRWYD